MKHISTPKYHPQVNVSERTNRTVLAAIRSFIIDSHQTWDNHIDEIRQALCNVVHTSTGFSPHFLVFGQHWVSHGSNYELIRKMQEIDGSTFAIQFKDDILSSVQKSVLRHLNDAHARNEKYYNKRTKIRSFNPDEPVFIRNFVQSDAINKYCAKLAPKFVKGFIVKPIGKVAYQVVNEKRKNLGVVHVKDILSRKINPKRS